MFNLLTDTKFIKIWSVEDEILVPTHHYPYIADESYRMIPTISMHRRRGNMVKVFFLLLLGGAYLFGDSLHLYPGIVKMAQHTEGCESWFPCALFTYIPLKRKPVLQTQILFQKSQSLLKISLKCCRFRHLTLPLARELMNCSQIPFIVDIKESNARDIILDSWWGIAAKLSSLQFRCQ